MPLRRGGRRQSRHGDPLQRRRPGAVLLVVTVFLVVFVPLEYAAIVAVERFDISEEGPNNPAVLLGLLPLLPALAAAGILASRIFDLGSGRTDPHTPDLPPDQSEMPNAERTSGGLGVSDERPSVRWTLIDARRLLLGVSFGLVAGVVGAGAYAAVVILTGHDILLLPMMLGAVVGSSVAFARSAVHPVWISATGVLLTLLSMLLVQYLLFWLWDGEGYSPMALTLGEAATLIQEGIAEDPIWVLLSWGAALVSAALAAHD